MRERGPAATAVCDLWAELTAKLARAANQCSRPEVVRRLKRMGVRRPETVAATLDRECARIGTLTALSGCAAQPEIVAMRMQELVLRDNLYQDFLDLAEVYQMLLIALALPPESRRHRWFQGRVRVHLAQAESIRLG